MTYPSKMQLLTGSNARLGVLSRERWAKDVPDVGGRLEIMAFSLGELLGERVVFISPTRDGARVYRIGLMRPVLIKEIAQNDRLSEWYAADGSKAGPNPYFYMVSADWRGTPTEYRAATSYGYFPLPAREVHGDFRFPDGTDEEIRQHIKKEWTDAELSDIATDFQEGVENVSSAVASTTAPIFWGLGIAVGIALLWKLS